MKVAQLLVAIVVTGGPNVPLTCPPGTRTLRIESYQVCLLPDGGQHGPSVIFFPDGGVREFSLFVNGELNGLRWTAHENGVRQSEMTMIDARSEGLTAHFHDNGRIATRGFSHHDRPVGEWLSWSPEGRLNARGRYDDAGLMTGDWLELTGAGNPWRGAYVDGQRHGMWVEHLADGGSVRTPYTHGEEGELRPCPAGTVEHRACVAMCCDVHGRWCETDAGVRLGPYDEWLPDGVLFRTNRGDGGIHSVHGFQ